MTLLRLLADDLTGALDAAEFVPLTGPVQAFWCGAIPDVLPPSAALDSGTRELSSGPAVAAVRRLAHHLPGSMIAFKKIDSLLRGQTIAELAVAAQGWQRCVVTPAFPFQGRITREGRQYVDQGDGQWRAAGPPIVDSLRAAGVEARAGQVGSALRSGVTVFDAETDEDLGRIAEAVKRWPQPILWSGTGGLAQALAAGQVAPPLPPLRRPILGLFGSDRSATMAQLEACDQHWMPLMDGGSVSAEQVCARLADTGVALVSFRLPPDTSRAAAAEHIADHINQLTGRLDPPCTLFVSGGETLRSLCESAGARSLSVIGRVVPGVPCSIICGGRWNGVTVISKSGAFGHPHLLRDLLAASAKRSAQ